MATSNRSMPNGSLREPSPEQPLSELISRTSSDLATLFRQEVELAKIEIRDEVPHTAKAGSMFGRGGFAGCLGVVLASLAVLFALDLAMPRWAAFSSVAALFA